MLSACARHSGAGTTHVNPQTSTESSHGCEEKARWSEVRQGGEQTRRERDETPEEGNAPLWQRGQGRQSEEPEAGDCDRTVRGAEEGSEGAEEKEKLTS